MKINLGKKVMVSDPCYGLNSWCQGVLENVLPGAYDCNVKYTLAMVKIWQKLLQIVQA